jgi:2-haloacid dehalogenase
VPPTTAVPPITAVVFDIGGVLLEWDPRHLYRKLFGGDDAAMERFLADVCTPDWHRAHDLGQDIAQSCAELSARHPGQADLILAWSRRGEEMIPGPVPGSAELLADLKKTGMACYGLSNMEAETFPVRLERFGFLRLLDGFVISGLERVAKPDPRIFRLLLDRFGLRADRTLFVDDAPANVAAAQALGINAIRFESAPQLRGALEARNLLPRAQVPTL